MHHRSKRSRGECRFARGTGPQWDTLDTSRGGRHEGRHGRDSGSRGSGSQGGGGRGSRGSRLFDHGELRFVLLQLIVEKPRHGYEIIKSIEDRAGGSYSPSPGVIYPTLTLLEEMGHAVITEEGGKKLYAPTDAGLAFLAANQRIADAANARMAEAAAARGNGPAPQIVRAMENLRLALRLRLGRGPMTEGEIRAIAAALDTAAGSVEQT